MLVYRNGSAVDRLLPNPPTITSGDSLSRLTLTVDWPNLFVTGPTGYWVSEDAGDTWRFVG